MRSARTRGGAGAGKRTTSSAVDSLPQEGCERGTSQHFGTGIPSSRRRPPRVASLALAPVAVVLDDVIYLRGWVALHRAANHRGPAIALPWAQPVGKVPAAASVAAGHDAFLNTGGARVPAAAVIVERLIHLRRGAGGAATADDVGVVIPPAGAHSVGRAPARCTVCGEHDGGPRHWAGPPCSTVEVERAARGRHCGTAVAKDGGVIVPATGTHPVGHVPAVVVCPGPGGRARVGALRARLACMVSDSVLMR